MGLTCGMEIFWLGILVLRDGNFLEPDVCMVLHQQAWSHFNLFLDIVYFVKIVTDGDVFMQKLEQRKEWLPSLLFALSSYFI